MAQTPGQMQTTSAVRRAWDNILLYKVTLKTLKQCAGHETKGLWLSSPGVVFEFRKTCFQKLLRSSLSLPFGRRGDSSFTR